MAWLLQGLTLVFIGLLVLLVRYIYGGCPFPYPVAVVMLIAMAAWTALTGSRTPDTFLKMTPAVEIVVAILVLYSELIMLRILLKTSGQQLHWDTGKFYLILHHVMSVQEISLGL